LSLTERRPLVLVTGANGFIGSHLAEALLAHGYRVRCMVRRSSDLSYVRHLPVEWAYADLDDPGQLVPACQDVDVVCHCAALTRALDQETFLRINAGTTEALARAALEANPGLQRFLYLSSQAAAGPSRSPDDVIDETRAPQPLDWYGKSKWAAEQALHSLDGRLPLTIIRPAAVFGPRDRDFFTYFDLVNRHLELRLGRKERLASLIYVRDLVDLIVLSLERQDAAGQTYFGCAWALSYGAFAQALARALDKRTVPVTVPVAALAPIVLAAKVQERLTGKPALLNEQRVTNMRQPYLLCSGDKARRELGFAPGYDLDTAVQETVAWYREHNWL
jgi:dihydroflavonol-4-reductase